MTKVFVFLSTFAFMLKDFHIITITHHNLNVDELGHFVIKHEGSVDLADKLEALKASFAIEEIIYLSTCNRITFVCHHSGIWGTDELNNFFKHINPDLTEAQLIKLPKFVRTYNGEDAINHLFEVAGSIDSLVVGEREIFRQFREAYQFSKEHNLAGDNLRLLERFTVKAAKEVYAKTKIGEKPLSIVSLAIQKLLQRKLPLDSRILMVGAGETNQLVGKFLVKHGYTNVVIFNRNLNNTDVLSTMLDAPAFHLSELENYDKGFDIFIICTGATHSLINAKIYSGLLNKDDRRKLVIDLSVPRNVEEEVVNTFDVDYVDIEQLRKLAEDNLNYRRSEIVYARKIIKENVANFVVTYQQRQIEKAFSEVPAEMAAVKDRAVSSVFAKELSGMDQDTKETVLNMLNYMEKKCVSIPMKLAKNIAKG